MNGTSTTITSTSITTTSTTLSTSTTTTTSHYVDFYVDARATVDFNSEIVEVELRKGEQTARMTARRDWTLEDFAISVLHQSLSVVPDKVFQKRVHIQAHQAGVVPDVLGWVIDDVSAEQLKDEAAAYGFGELPGWSSWTADEAETWIEDNVDDLASAKVALKAMARAVVLLRDWRR